MTTASEVKLLARIAALEADLERVKGVHKAAIALDVAMKKQRGAFSGHVAVKWSDLRTALAALAAPEGGQQP